MNQNTKFKKNKIRIKLNSLNNTLPRVCIYKSLKYDYLQLIDQKGVITGLSSQKIKGKDRNEKVIKLAEEFAKKIKNKQITAIIFDRSGYKYHGRVKLIAETLRKNGIKF
jgi:large subunit ribosomal protein L18